METKKVIRSRKSHHDKARAFKCWIGEPRFELPESEEVLNSSMSKIFYFIPAALLLFAVLLIIFKGEGYL